MRNVILLYKNIISISGHNQNLNNPLPGRLITVTDW